MLYKLSNQQLITTSKLTITTVNCITEQVTRLVVTFGLVLHAQHIVCRYVAPPGECYYNTIMFQRVFFRLSVVSCTFSVLRVYSKFGHHPHPLGNLCAKFRFFHGVHCWASPRRKIAYSLNHSLTQPIFMPREPKRLRNWVIYYAQTSKSTHIHSSTVWAFHISQSNAVCVCVWMLTRPEQIITIAQTYLWKLISHQKLGQCDLLYRSKSKSGHK